MKFGMTNEQKAEADRILVQKMQIPEKRFAYFPVKLSNGLTIWMEFYWKKWGYLDWVFYQD